MTLGTWLGGNSILEDYTGDNFNGLRDGVNWQGENFDIYYYDNLISGFDWSNIEPEKSDFLFRLFWYTAQKTQYWASDDKNGNIIYRDLDNTVQNWVCSGSGSTNLWVDFGYTSCSDFINNSVDLDIMTVDQETNATIPHAMKATAGLYQLFWDTVHSYSWPTYQHDNRRTGFTLLKGDMSKESQVEKINLVLQGDASEDTVSRNSIADLDNDGNMEIVVTAARNTNEGYIYAVETSKKWASKKLKTEEKWSVNIGENIKVTPTIANIDSDPEKEIVFGLADGRLKAIDVDPSGESASLKWTYNFPEKEGFYGDFGNTLVADLDNDGINEIIVMDSDSGPSWSGEVFVLVDNGNHATLKTKYNISNGGGWGAISAANVDDDNNLELIVPSYYGVYVLDYDGSTLTKKCSTDDGRLWNSVVVSDIDRDNEYELIYATTTNGCGGGINCYNKIYIVDPTTCNNEAGWPKSIDYYSRTAPAIANMDNDDNIEIIISARNTALTSDYSSNILCYDSNTGDVDCNYSVSGDLELEAYEISPHIFDVNGDGENNIVMPDKHYKVHILNNDGTEKYTIEVDGIIGSAPAIGDIDGDGKAEMALKRSGSPYNILTIISDLNKKPYLNSVDSITALAGELININESGLLKATDENNDNLTYYYSSPFNESGLWQTTVNDTGDYSIMIEVSDGNLTDYQYAELKVFNSTINLTNTFSDLSIEKSLTFTGTQTKTVEIRIPKNHNITYSQMRIKTK